MTDYEHWMDAFDRAWHHPEMVDSIECPTCVTRALTLVYTVRSVGDREGMSAFWCHRCLRGLPPRIGELPKGFSGTLFEAAPIPNYNLIVPDSSSVSEPDGE